MIEEPNIKISESGEIVRELKPKSFETGMIGKFIKLELINRRELAWPREIKIFKSLLKIYPDKEFWDWLRIDFKLNSLAYFKRADGAELLEKKKKSFDYEKSVVLAPQEDYTNAEKVGEDKKISKKPKSLMEFLR